MEIKFPLMVIEDPGQTKIKKKIVERMEKWPNGFDFTISTYRLEWFKKFLKANGFAHEEIADSHAWLSERVTRRTTMLWEFLTALFRAQSQHGEERPNPTHWMINAVGACDLVAEDFRQQNIIPIICISIAPNEEMLEIRERQR